MAEFSVLSKSSTETLAKRQILDNDDQSIDKVNNLKCDLNEAVNLECNKDNNEVVKRCDYDNITTTNTESALMLQGQFDKIQIDSTDDPVDDCLLANSVGTKPKIKNHVHRPEQIGTDNIENRSKQPQCDHKSDDDMSLAHSFNSGPAAVPNNAKCPIDTVPLDGSDITEKPVPKSSLHVKQNHASLLKSQSLDLGIDDCALLNIDRKLHSRLLPNINEYRSTDCEIQLATDDEKQTAYDTVVRSEETCPHMTQRPSVTSMMFQSAETRPIYPNVPYSPYGSPFGSPRSVRRRPPLRESRRISIEKSGSFLQLNQYKLMDKIGQGSYGLVKLAYSEEDSTHYAMKILSKKRLLRQAALMRRSAKQTTSPLDRVYREIAVLKKLDHPNIVKLVEVLDDPVEDSLYMVFELVKNGEVLSIPTDKPLSEERAWSVFRDTLLGLEYLHYQKIIHADLKPGNLLLTECGHVKIADLGVCNEFLGEDATMSNGSTAGTPAFRAPETLILGKNVYCGRAADIWALGVTLFSLVYGNVPFADSSIPKLYEKIQNEEVIFPESPKISDGLRNCIVRMLEKDASYRITLPQLKENIWVTRNGLCPLPTEDENCCLVQIDDEDINSVVRSIPKLDTLILIKTMLKNHSFGNPFMKGISGRAPQPGGSRLQKFIQAGRSNSAPGSYHIALDKQQSSENTLPSLTEHCSNQNI